MAQSHAYQQDDNSQTFSQQQESSTLRSQASPQTQDAAPQSQAGELSALHEKEKHPHELETLTRYRRDLHQIPELDFELPETVAYVREVLERDRQRLQAQGIGTQLFSPCRSSLCLFVDRGSSHATAIRSDMDALPVSEKTGLAFASRHAGRMHACGHDGHMAMVLTLADWLVDHAEELPRSILLVFQPAEETTGGARLICESGVFERYHVDRIFGFHLWPDLPAGIVASKPGALLAASNETHVSFHGKATHIATAAKGADAIEAAARFLSRSYDYIDEVNRSESGPVIFKFGSFHGGTVCNQIADEARILGSLRTFSTDTRDMVMEQVKKIAASCSERAGCTAEVDFAEGYPPVVNDEQLFSLVRPRLSSLAAIKEPFLIAEDFAWYQQHLPGVFFLLGTGTGIPLHSDGFVFDEQVLLAGLATYKQLVMIA